jgi:hypothetical protein
MGDSGDVFVCSPIMYNADLFLMTVRSAIVVASLALSFFFFLLSLYLSSGRRKKRKEHCAVQRLIS